MTSPTRTLQERLEWIVKHVTVMTFEVTSACFDAASALDAKDALLSEAEKAMKPFAPHNAAIRAVLAKLKAASAPQANEPEVVKEGADERRGAEDG